MGKSKTTIVDIAREAGTSISTVSYVLNNGPRSVSAKTRQKILRTVKRLSYSPDRVASSLKRRRTMSIGVIFPDMTNNYFPETLRGILEITQNEKYNIILRNAARSDSLQEDCVRDLFSQRVDGFVIRPIAGSPFPAILQDSGIPFVVVDRPEGEWEKHDSVSVDNRKAIRMAAEILMEEGHERIALITGPKNTGTSIEREKGFRDSIGNAGADPQACRTLHGDYSLENGRQSMRILMEENPEITAVITASTRITYGAIQALREAKKSIPEEFSIVAYGYAKWLSLFFPPITTIEQPIVEMGRRAVRILLDKIENGEQSDIVRVVIDPVRIDGLSHQINF